MTNRARWSNPESLSPQWADRARFAARLVPERLRILDLGCGGMDIERFASPLRYVPIDIVARDARTHVIDLNETPPPPALFADIDLITLLGVLEYLDDAEKLFDAITSTQIPLLFSYCSAERHSNCDRRASDWVNDFTTEQILQLLEARGYEAAQLFIYEGEQIIVLAAPKGKWPAWLAERLQPARTDREPRRKSLVLAGFYGRGNCGDEAILQTVYESFSADYDIIISVDGHGAYPGFWDWYPYNQAKIIHQTNLERIATDSSLAGIIVGGGGLPLGFAANQVFMARAAGLRTALAGTDLWLNLASDTEAAHRSVGDYLNLFDFVAVRHGRSFSYPGAETFAALKHGADWALALQTDAAQDIVIDKSRVLVTVREFPLEWLSYQYTAGMAEMIGLIRSRGFEPVMMPFCPEDERFLTEMNIDQIAPVERCWWNPRRAKQLIASSGLMLSVGRLHPLIFAASTGVPVASVHLAASPTPSPCSKLMDMEAELGFTAVQGADELQAFLDCPRPAKSSMVAAAAGRLDAMIVDLRTLFAS